jgi:hypothetical protein
MLAFLIKVTVEPRDFLDGEPWFKIMFRRLPFSQFQHQFLSSIVKVIFRARMTHELASRHTPV